MEQITYYANIASLSIIVALWLVFAGTFFLQKRPESSPDAKREEKSWLGLILQGAGFALVWAPQRRPFFSSLIDGPPALNLILDAIAVALCAASVWLAISAVKELGKQWSLAARLVENHKLVMSGVYSIVRHPIYTAMLGMLIATGLVVSQWFALLAAIVVFFVGTKIRTRFEEALLRDAFGTEFETWERKVPGLIPFVKL